MFYWLGLIIVFISWILGALLIIKWRDKSLPTISQHAASNKKASLLFAGTLAICGTTFYFWLMTWFVPHVQLGLQFQILLTIAVLCQLIAGFISDTKGLKRKIHRIVAYIMAGLYIPMAGLIATSPNISTIAQTITVIGILYMFMAFFFVIVLKKLKKHSLVLQILYILAFQIIILATAYI